MGWKITPKKGGISFHPIYNLFLGPPCWKKKGIFHPLRPPAVGALNKGVKTAITPGVAIVVGNECEILLPKKHVMFVQQKKGQIVSYHTYHKYCIVFIIHSIHWSGSSRPTVFRKQNTRKTCFFSKCVNSLCGLAVFLQVTLQCLWSCPFSLRVEATQWSKLKERDSGGGIPIKPSISNGKKVSPISNVSTLTLDRQNRAINAPIAPTGLVYLPT